MFNEPAEIRHYIESLKVDDWKYDNVPCNFKRPAGFCIDQSFVTGGVQGGSCWESSNPHEFTSDNRYELVRGRLYQFLMAVDPDISFGKFSRIKNAVLSSTTFTEREYYGNSTDYEVWLIDVDKLFELLSNDA